MPFLFDKNKERLFFNAVEIKRLFLKFALIKKIKCVIMGSSLAYAKRNSLNTPRTVMYSLLLALIYLAFISLGLPDSLLGAGWPVMHEAFGVPVPYMGIVTMLISGCTILSSLASDRVTRKFGANVVTVFSVFLTAAALMGFSFATSFWHLLILAIPYGLGAGAIDAAPTR